ncbi:alpha/beta hydrolase, partial [Candidatus Auribacterota bacterium]
AWVLPYDINDTPAIYNLPYENISFKTSDQLEIKGWFIKNEMPSQTTLIVCHGFETNKSDILGVASFLYRGGYNLLLFDFRGHGESQKSHCSFGLNEQYDLLGAVHFLKKHRFKQSQKIGLWGGSMGAAVGLVTAKICSEISVIVSDCAFKSLSSALMNHLKLLYGLPKYPLGYLVVASYMIYFRKNPFFFTPLQAVGEFKNLKGLLIIHGKEDERTPVSDAYALYEKTICPKEILIVEEAKHFESHAILEKKYETKVLEFFKKHL